MKKSFVLILSSLMMATAALAGNEGPGAAPIAPTPPTAALIGEVSTGRGLLPPDMPQSWGVRVYADGTVNAFEDENETTVATLSEDATAKLVKKLDSVKKGKLVDPSAGEPECFDAPSTYFTIYPGDLRKEKVIAKNVGCHDYLLDSEGTYEARDALQALRDLAGALH